jgi:hypothetical protein
VNTNNIVKWMCEVLYKEDDSRLITSASYSCVMALKVDSITCGAGKWGKANSKVKLSL